MSGTDLPEYTVVTAMFHHSPIVGKELDAPVDELLVRTGDTWTPVGCETWWILDEELHERATLDVHTLGDSNKVEALQRVVRAYMNDEGYVPNAIEVGTPEYDAVDEAVSMDDPKLPGWEKLVPHVENLD
jgi:hypothetical protein